MEGRFLDDDLVIEFYEELQIYYLPRVDGIGHCSYGVWCVFDGACEWLFWKKRKGVPVNDR